MTTHERVAAEIEALHVFFVQWFSGAIIEDESAFDQGFLSRLDPASVLIPPAGNVLPMAELASGIRSAHGSNPQFRIAIRNVQVRWEFGDHIVATYEEWQRNALASTPPDNGRVATVLFHDSAGTLIWRHIHETWLPENVMSAGPYDF